MAPLNHSSNRLNGMSCRPQTTSTPIFGVSLPSRKPDSISTLRWHAALAVYKLKGVLPDLAQERTQLQASTTTVQLGDSFHDICPLVPSSAQTLFSHLSIDANWTHLKAAFLADGYRVALLHAVVAVLINHIRRIFVPCLGSFWFYHPIEDLRLALSNPDVFLEQTTDLSWYCALCSFLQRAAVDLSAYWVVLQLHAEQRRWLRTTHNRYHTSSKSVTATVDGLIYLGKIYLGVYMFTTLDYIFCRSLHTVSIVIAVYKLTSGTKADHLAFKDLTDQFSFGLVLTVWMAVGYIWYAVGPTLKRALTSAARGRPGLLLIVFSAASSVWAMLRYRARIFIWLEIMPMFVVLGEIVLVLAILATEFVSDPLGLNARAVLTGAHENGPKRVEATEAWRRQCEEVANTATANTCEGGSQLRHDNGKASAVR